MFLGDYIYEYATRSRTRCARVEGGEAFTLAQYRARYATYKSDPALQAAHAAAPWLLVWDDHEVSNDYAGLRGEDLGVDMRARRAAAYRAYWEHMPFPKAARPRDTDMRIVGRLDWGRAGAHPPARRPPVPRSAGLSRSRAAAARTRCALARLPGAPRPGAHAARRASRSAGSPTAGTSTRPWNLLAQQTLMARFTWLDPARRRRRLLDRRLGRLRAGAQPPARDGRGEEGARASSSSAATCTATTSPTSSPTTTTRRRRSSRANSAAPRSPACRCRSRASTRRARSIRTSTTGAADQRGYIRFELDARQLRARLQVVERPIDPRERRHDGGALRRRRRAGGRRRRLAGALRNGPACSAAPSTAHETSAIWGRRRPMAATSPSRSAPGRRSIPRRRGRSASRPRRGRRCCRDAATSAAPERP